MPKGKNYVCVKNLCVRKNVRVRKKKFTRRGGGPIGILRGGGPIEVPELVVIVLLWGHGVRKPPGGYFRR